MIVAPALTSFDTVSRQPTLVWFLFFCYGASGYSRSTISKKFMSSEQHIANRQH